MSNIMYMHIPLDIIKEIAAYSDFKLLTRLMLCNRYLSEQLKAILDKKVALHSSIITSDWLSRLQKPSRDPNTFNAAYLSSPFKNNKADIQYIMHALTLFTFAKYLIPLKDDDCDKFLRAEPENCQYFITPADNYQPFTSIALLCIKYDNPKTKTFSCFEVYKTFIPLKEFLNFMYRHNIDFKHI